MVHRGRLELDGLWQFQLDPDERLTATTLAPDRMIRVPGCWQAQFPDLLTYSGVAWYRRSFNVPAGWAGDRLRLVLGAVDYVASIFVNDQLVAEHEGGYLPIAVEIGAVTRFGQPNTLTVRVVDVAHQRLVFSRWSAETGLDARAGYDPDEIPHGKQSWYCNVGGLWQSVWLERQPPTAIDRLVARPLADRSGLTITAQLRGLSAPSHLAVTIQPVDGQGQIYAASLALAAGQTTAELAVAMPGARVWSPETPVLYTVTATLQTTVSGGGDPLDQTSITTGLRTIAVRAGQLWLNDRPLYLRSALDQDFFPETAYTVPSREYLHDQFTKAKALGLNSLRLHIKPADPLYLAVADEVGLLIWEEVPSWRTLWPKERLERQGDLPERVRRRVSATLRGLIERDVNHPSVIAYSIVNEDWGTQLVTSASDRAWLGELYALAKSLDPTRLICDNSPCNGPRGPNIHVRTDIDDFHIYFGMPDHAGAFEAFVDSLALRPAWTFSQHGDAQRSGDEVLLLSEFGNWGLPEYQAMARHWPDGVEPWWMASHAWWHGGGNEISHPSGLAQRLRAYGLERIWPDADAFARATQWHQFAALQAELMAIRQRPALRGYVVTEFTDCYWEANGLLDFYRQPKVFHQEFARIGGPTVLPLTLPRHAYWSGERLSLPLGIAHDGPNDLGALTLAAQLGDTGPVACRVERVAAGTYHQPPALRLSAPAVSTATTLDLQLTARDNAGRTLASDRQSLTLVPAAWRQAERPLRIAVYSPPPRAAAWVGELVTEPTEQAPTADYDELDRQPPLPATNLTRQLRQLGYQLVDDPGQADLTLATDINAALLAHLQAGGRLLYLPASDVVSPFLPVLHRSSPWDGNWISAFHYIQPGPWRRRLPAENPLGFAYRSILPPSLITGFGDEHRDDILAGLVLGWCARPAVTLGQFRVGQGRVIMSTFGLLPALGRDPIATIMLHDVLAYLTSAECRPGLQLQ